MVSNALNPMLIGSYVVAILFEILFPIVVGFYINRRFGARWRFFLYGALIFFLSQIITRIPLVQITESIIGPTLATSETLVWIWLIVLSFTAGIFEEVGRYLGYRFLIKPDDRKWNVGLMFGAGHGGLESMLLVGGLVLLGLINVIVISTTDFSAANLPPEQLAQLEAVRAQIAGMEWWTPLLGAYERFITIFFQIALAIIVLQVFIRKSLLWLFAAILLHGVVNLTVITAVRFVGPLWTEVLLTIMLPISLAIIYYFRPQGDDAAAPPAGAPAVAAQ